MACILQAQEDCTNGIDDDNDGLIDLQDDECQCLSPTGYYFLEDFENNVCCPQYFTSVGNPFGIECLNGMSAASVGTPDYFHTCGYLGGLMGPDPPVIPLPMPSGMGAAGTVVMPNNVEYIGTCLPSPLVAGVPYEFSVYVGFNTNNTFASNSPLLINIYAANNCSSNFPSSQIFCLGQDPNWVVIGSMTVSGNIGEWVQVSTTITPGINYEAIAFGAPCNYASGNNYYFFDDFQITGGGVEQIPIDNVISENGDCITGVTLTSTTFPGAEYQWYFNGIAIPGATSSTYPVPPGEEGLYQVVVTVGSDCGVSDEYEVVIDENVLDVEATIENILCFNDNDGSISLILPSENTPHQILWSNGASSPNIDLLSPGIYTVTITDSKGCYSEEEYEILQPNELELILDYVIQPGSGSNTGEAGILVAGGTPDYEIEWSNGGDGYKETGLEPGHYTITVTDENGCIDTVGFDIVAPFQAQLSFTPSSCLACSGSINLMVNGGVEPIEVLITNIETGQATLGPAATNLCPTLYVYTITDGIGNTVQDTVDLGLASRPKVKLDSIQQYICAGDTSGMIAVKVNGGNPQYKYKWSNQDTTSRINKLLPGWYALTVTDQVGCTDTVRYLLSSLPPVITEVTSQSAGCLAGGQLSATVVQGTSPYKWQWSTGDTTAMLTNVAAGQYLVTVTDSLGCRAIDTAMVIQQGGIQTSYEINNAHCEEVKDGYINLNPISYNGYVTYEWSNGSTEEDIDSLGAGVYMVTITDEIGCRLVQEYTIITEAPYQVSADITTNLCNNDSLASITLNITGGSNYVYTWSEGSIAGELTGLKAADYSVTITDAYGCKQSYQYTITDPPVLKIESAIKTIKCAGNAEGEISLTATGGTGMYTYKINGKDTGTNNTGLEEGTYSLVVRDENGCIDTSVVKLKAMSNASLTSQITEAPCGENEGSVIDVTVGGGIEPYDYKWSNGITTEDLRDVPAGNYAVTVTDKLGCEITDTIQLTNTDGPAVMVSGEDVSCNGENDGQLIISAQHGSPPYSIYVNGELKSGLEIKELTAGIYEVMVVDAKGCEIKTSYEIEEPDVLTGLIVEVIQPDINKITGSASVAVSGGKDPYTISWDNGETGEKALTLNPGTHTLTITDSGGCTAEAEVTIVKSAIYAIWDKQDNACAGDCKGEITITIQNEDGSEKIVWTDGGTGIIRTGLCAGEYQWTITDGYGNTITSPVVNISTPQPIKMEVVIKGESCENKEDGQATIIINGGTPNYTIKWDGVTGTETANLNTGEHLIEIKDANGCLTDTVVNVPKLESANITGMAKDAICEGGGELTIQTTADTIIDLVINGIKYSLNKELKIAGASPGLYVIEQQMSDSCKVYKEEVSIGSESFITGGSIENEIEVKEGEQITLDLSTLTITGSYMIEWKGIQQDNCEQTDATGNCLKYEYVPDGPHEVSAYILSDQGCDSLISFNIRVLVDNDVFFPNVFGVGNNNVFKPTDKTGKTRIESFEIYDRWGSLVFRETAVDITSLKGWDGTFNGSRAEQGVYVYHLQILDTSGKIKNKVGDVTLLR